MLRKSGVCGDPHNKTARLLPSLPSRQVIVAPEVLTPAAEKKQFCHPPAATTHNKTMESDSDSDSDDGDNHGRQRRKMVLFMAMMSQLKQKRFRHMLSLEGRRRRDRRIPREALVIPAFSPWERLCQSGNDQALITTTGCDHQMLHFATFCQCFNLCLRGAHPGPEHRTDQLSKL